MKGQEPVDFWSTGSYFVYKSMYEKQPVTKTSERCCHGQVLQVADPVEWLELKKILLKE